MKLEGLNNILPIVRIILGESEGDVDFKWRCIKNENVNIESEWDLLLESGGLEHVSIENWNWRPIQLVHE